jgi:DNA-binding SARP family transcriptional activator
LRTCGRANGSCTERRQIVDAHTALADLVADTDLTEAARLLDAAITHDPTDEDIYRKAIRIQHGLGNRDAIRSLLRRLAAALHDERDAVPSPETVDLATDLRRSLTE